MKKTKILSLTLVVLLIALAMAMLIVPASAAASNVKAEDFSATGLNLTLDEDYAYSFAVVGDTQTLNYNDIKAGTDNMSKMYQWIVDNKDSKNIQYVLGLGDITDQHYIDFADGRDVNFRINTRGWNETYANTILDGGEYYNEWYHAMKAVSLLNGQIDYTLVRGNHDTAADYTEYIDKYNPGYRDAIENDADSGIYGDGSNLENTYRKVEIEGEKYIIITLDVGQDDDMLTWLDGVLNYADDQDYKAIITVHEFLSPDTSILDTTDTTIIPSLDNTFAVPNANDPRELWEEVLKKHVSVSMVLSGHMTADDVRVTQVRGDEGNTVTWMLIDPQHMDLTDNTVGGNVGMVAMFYFSEDGNVVNIEYISTMRATDGDDTTDAYHTASSQTINLAREWTKVNEYDYIPTEIYENPTGYPFVTIFDDDNNPETTNLFLGGFSSLISESGAAGALPECLYTVKTGAAATCLNKKLTYLLMRDFDTTTDGDVHTNFGNLGQNTGIHNLDLNGHTFTVSGTANLFNPNMKRKDTYAPTYNITNGNIVLAGSGNVLGIGVVNNAEYKCAQNVNITGVTFSYKSASATGAIISSSSAALAQVSNLVKLDNCTFDFTKVVPSGVTLFKLNETDKNLSTEFSITNSKILMSSQTEISGFEIITANDNDTVSYLQGLTLEMPTPASHPTSNFAMPDGNKSFVEIAKDTTAGTSTYSLQTITFEYGTIPADYLSAVEFPFVVFGDKKDVGPTVKGYTTWLDGESGMLWQIREDFGYSSNPHNAILRRDFQIVNGTHSNMGQSTSTLNVDLQGFTLTTAANQLFKLSGKRFEGSTNFTVKNGIVELYQAGLIYTTSSINRTFNLGFENVTVKFAEDANSNASKIITEGSVTTDGVSVATNLTFNNCVFDFANAPDNIVFFDASTNTTDSLVAKATMSNCEFKLSDYSKFTLAKLSDGIDSISFGTDSSNMLKLELPSGAAAPADYYTAGEDTYSFKLTATSDDADTYTLGKDVYIENYGRVPYAYADAGEYPFVWFQDRDNDGVAEFQGGEKHWSAGKSGEQAGILLVAKDNAFKGPIFALLRRDFQDTNGYFQYIGHVNGTVNIDLGGHTLSANGHPFFAVYQWYGPNHSSGERYPIFNVSNGTMLVRRVGLINAYTRNYVNGSGQEFKFNFENVTIGFTDDANVNTIINCDTAGQSGQSSSLDITFTDCTFDFSNRSGESYLINLELSEENHTANITVNGCNLKAGEETTLEIAKLTEGYDTLTFARVDGKYLTVEVDKDSTAPTGTYVDCSTNLESTEDDIALAFKKVSSTETTDIYELAIKAVANIDFTPKVSVTLDSNLIFNIYIPEHAGLKSATLNGDTVTLGEAKDGYYLVSTELAASEAAKELKLVVTLEIDGTSVKGTFTFSLTKYVSKILAADLSDEEKTLVKDILAYVRSAYVYFNGASSSDEEIVAIDEVLDGYEGKTLTKVEDNYTNDGAEILEGVTFVLEATPRIRFYLTLAEGESVSNYTFMIDNSVLEIFGTGTEENDETYKGLTYVDISLYAYRMIEDITITKGNLTSYYNIVSYVNGALDSSDEALKTIVSKFYIYCESAAEYRTAAAK